MTDVDKQGPNGNTPAPGSLAYRETMRFEHTFIRYQLELAHWGRVPQSREAIAEEARRSGSHPCDLLWRKITRLEP